VAARWAETIFCRPPRHAPKPAEEAFLATGERSSIRNEGEELAIWSWGSGPVVVLAHGWGSRAGRFTGMAGALIEAGFTVVLFDAPAHGASTGQQASLPQFARALRAVGAAVGQIHGLVGHSLGGAAISLALHQGLSAERVVLLAPPADVFLFTRAFSEHLRVPHRARQVMQHNLETRLQITWKELHIPTLARAMSARALVIHDVDDPDVPFTHGREIADAWPGAILVPTSGLGHRGLARNPEVIRRSVLFLQGDAGR
jgi:pimeloyl-ACP methyl ester carboxylesterase